MCNQRRSTFQRVSMEDNGSVTTYVSINLRQWQAIVTIAALIFTMIGSLVGAVTWTRSSILKITETHFQQAADAYYKAVIPERNQYYSDLLASELMRFERQTSKPIEARLDQLNSRVTAVETQVGGFGKRLDRHEDLLLEILRRLPER